MFSKKTVLISDNATAQVGNPGLKTFSFTGLSTHVSRIRLSILSVVVFLLSINVVISQHLVTKISLLDSKIDSLEVFTLGDSILLTYTEGLQDRSMRRFKWCSPTGDIRNTYIPIKLLAIAASSTGVNFYYLDKTDKSLLKAKQEIGGIVKDLSWYIKLEGSIVGAYVDEDLFLILYERSKQQLKVLQVRDLQVVDEKKFLIPKAFAKDLKNNNRIDFFIRDSPINSFKGLAKTKVYKEDNSIYITREAKKDIKILGLDLLNESVIQKGIPLNDHFEYSSFLLDEVLFIYGVTNKEINLKAYAVENANVIANYNAFYSKVDTLKKPVAKFYQRIGRGYQVSKHTLRGNMLTGGKGWDKSLVAFRSKEGKTFLKCGLYFDSYNGGYVFGLTNPVTALLVFAVTTGINEALDEQGILLYNYYEFEDATFKLSVSPDHLRQKIDDFEISALSSDNKKYRHKSYVAYKNGVLGIYQVNKDNQLILVKYEHD